MRKLTCIVCPMGCALEADDSKGEDSITVTGNRCLRGASYAMEEIRSPKRVVTATCAINGEGSGSIRRVPVKTATPCPIGKISALLEDIYKVKINLPVKAGDVVISDWDGSKIDIVAARTLN